MLCGTKLSTCEAYGKSSTVLGHICGHNQSRSKCFQVPPWLPVDILWFFLFFFWVPFSFVNLRCIPLNSSKMTMTLDLQPVISQTQLVHLWPAVDSLAWVGREHLKPSTCGYLVAGCKYEKWLASRLVTATPKYIKLLETWKWLSLSIHI